jgi:hypothetical protein
MNYFFDTFLAPQRKVTRLPGRTPGTSVGTKQEQRKSEAHGGRDDGGFQPALPA